MVCPITDPLGVPSEIIWSSTLTDLCHSTSNTYGSGGSATGSATAGTNSAGKTASGVNDSEPDYPDNVTSDFGSTINSPSFVEQTNGTYQYSINITTDSLSTSAVTTQGNSATGTADSGMVVNSVDFVS